MDMRRSSFKVGHRRRFNRASGVISGVLALPSSVVVDRCGSYHRRSPLVRVMRELTLSLPSKASVIIIDAVRDCGHSPLAAAIVSSIRGEGSGGWSCGGRCQINCGHSRVVGVITAGALSTAPGLIRLKHLAGYKSFLCALLTASGHQSRRGLVVNYKIDGSIEVGLHAIVALVRSQRCRSRSRSKSWV
jgi:hypothetical protein